MKRRIDGRLDEMAPFVAWFIRRFGEKTIEYGLRNPLDGRDKHVHFRILYRWRKRTYQDGPPRPVADLTRGK